VDHQQRHGPGDGVTPTHRCGLPPPTATGYPHPPRWGNPHPPHWGTPTHCVGVPPPTARSECSDGTAGHDTAAPITGSIQCTHARMHARTRRSTVWTDHLENAVRLGLVSEATVTQALRRNLRQVDSPRALFWPHWACPDSVDSTHSAKQCYPYCGAFRSTRLHVCRCHCVAVQACPLVAVTVPAAPVRVLP
jgi:hypothetical protein